MNKLRIPRVVKMPVEVQATNTLRDAIINGTIPGGSRVTEIQISERINLSRATVRTALHQLASEGLVSLVPYTGWTVVSLTAQDVWELYTIRSGLERLAGQLLAKAITPEKSKILNRAFQALEKACASSDSIKIAEADYALHKTIISLTEHSRLISQYDLIGHQIRMYIRSSDALIAEPGVIVEQHRPIVDAILAADVERAGFLSENHNLTEGERLSAYMKDADKPARPRKIKKRAAL
jgi:DNA-binding GntR family transcriptional regulator